MGIGTLAGFGAALALAGLPTGADGQTPDGRFDWQPFLGCWEAEGAERTMEILCFVADGDQVEILTIADGAIRHRAPFTVGGQARRTEQDGCVTTESASFSDDGRRIHTASEVACQGQVPHRGTGIIFMPSAEQWVDVRSSRAEGEEATVWVQWFVRTDESQLNELGIRSGRITGPLTQRRVALHAMSPISIDNVIDAWENVDEEAVEAWIAEVGRGFAGLDSEDLLKLDAAGISGDLIDVVVAVSFPERFALREADVPLETESVGVRPLWGDPYYYGYSRYAGYSPYGYYSSHGRYYYPRQTVIVLVAPLPGNRAGRVVAGRGYTRGDRGSSTVGRTSGSEGSTTASSGTTSSGNSRSSTGRKAKPRGGSGK